MSDPRVTVITGASQGIGRHLALVFAEAGDSLVLAARNQANLEETAARARESGSEALVLPTDVTDADDVEAMTAAALDRFGRIDVRSTTVALEDHPAPFGSSRWTTGERRSR
jgi:NAD(P)-dependent dehydrogenase (short-subunit alcohol dehydrogenase family)